MFKKSGSISNPVTGAENKVGMVNSMLSVMEADFMQCLQTALDKVQLSVAAPDSVACVLNTVQKPQ